MSTPRVGSSSSNNRGSVSNIRPKTTFCWFPPDRVPTGSRIRPSLTLSCRTLRSVADTSARRRTSPATPSRSSTDSTVLASTECSSTRPELLRSSGTKAMPSRSARCGPLGRTRCPSMDTRPSHVPEDAAPNSDSSSSVRPEPSNPHSPTISPRRTVRSMPSGSRRPTRGRRGRTANPETDSRSAPMVPRSARYIVCTDRPTIASAACSAVSFRASNSATLRPLRSTVARSATCPISSIRCEM